MSTARLTAALLALGLLVVACGRRVRDYAYPTPVDTRTREVRLLSTERFPTDGAVTAEADYPGARLASFRVGGTDSASGLPLYVAEIPAENEPINPSPWYSFRLTAPRSTEAVIRLEYPPTARHRYQPKTASTLSGPWTYVPGDRVDTSGHLADVTLTVPATGIYLSAQEVIATDSISRWIDDRQATGSGLTLETIGRSRLGRPIWKLELNPALRGERNTLVFLSRQHPPEVTGFQAFQAFFDELLTSDEPAVVDLRQNHRIIAFPVVNPDGVDEGHWRHSAGGIDLNRDWAEYRQPEVRAIVEWLQRNTERDEVVWGMDFHSTQYDVLYTHDPVRVAYAGDELVDRWTAALAAWSLASYPGASDLPTEDSLGRVLITGQDTLRVEPDAIGKPTSASWFAQHYGGIGVTYEVGDEQDRDYLRAKAREAARQLARAISGATDASR